MDRLNRDVFAVDPTDRRLPNNGVAALEKPSSQAQFEVLKYELESFVAQGEYGEGLRRILNSFVTQVDNGVQPAVWVSGFYGSGKSHFLRVLTYLWSNEEVEGVSPRTLVDLPPDVSDLLTELDSFAKRVRTIRFAAAGTLRVKNSQPGVSAAAQPLLEIVLKAAGFPTLIGPALFTLWLKETEGRYEEFMQELDARGKQPIEVERSLFMSREIREALLHIYPEFAPSTQLVGQALASQFKLRDVSDDLVIDTIRRVLETVARESQYDNASMPLTLIVLDEVQEHVNDRPEIVGEVRDLVERLTREFEGRLLVVAAGQSALNANQILARFMDRFTVRVQLKSKDVETVVREVVLRKKPEAVPALESTLGTVSGEISKHLEGSKMAAVASDGVDLVRDYPMLPTRRRFMESTLRAVDRGAAGQLRSQLRVTLDAVRDVAGQQVGNVVPGDAVYSIKKDDMLSQGVLLGDLEARIDGVRDGNAEGELKARAVALVFLISHLDEAEGVRPTVDTLADLLVTDLNVGSSSLRQSLPGLLATLDGDVLVLDGDEYRLQSPEDAEWERLYRSERSRFLVDTNQQVDSRRDALIRALDQDLGKLKVTQGVSGTPRKWTLHFAEAPPPIQGDSLYVWVQMGWDQTQSKIVAQAREAGIADSGVYVWLPKQDDKELKEAIAEERAAHSVVGTQPPPTTEQGQQTRDGMLGRGERAQSRIDEFARQILANASVYLGGGSQPSSVQGGLNAQVRAALDVATVREYSDFGLADERKWNQVFSRAQQGNSEALKAVGHDGDVLAHPVVSRVLSSLSKSQRKGLDILKEFQAAPYGWPKEAVYAALAVLVQTEHVEAQTLGKVVTASNLTENAMGKLEFTKQTTVLTFPQKQQLKKLAHAVGVDSGGPEMGVPAVLQTIRDVAAQAGGRAPLPQVPETAHLEQLQGGFGTERMAVVAEEVPQLLSDLETWRTTIAAIPGREIDWEEAEALLRHASSLPVYIECHETVEAIREQRSLLTDPNPIRPVIQRLESELRHAVIAAHDKAADARKAALDKLHSQPEWTRLLDEEQADFLDEYGLVESAKLNVAEGTVLLAELDRFPMGARQQQAIGYPGKVDAAGEGLRKRFMPLAKTVRPKSATLESEEAVSEYVDALKQEILDHIRSGSPVSIQN